ncbi:putative lipid II flippase FtsW [Agarilytica rhodophyticola]|uniref:putative lipid II flippase FtsW n=1 Tax=Agarilytica rhodophyticola TaxID=1737490 RepID=UPI000B3432D3|nr:putative lipid II flippase FtsW [Agarilytica rhodophyticola]
MNINLEQKFNTHRIDFELVCVLLALISVGLVMVASSSMDFAAARYGDEWLLFRKQCILLMMGISAGVVVACIPLSVWEKYSGIFLCLAIIFLFIVLLPGIGKSVNGSQRWLPMGLFSIQASELAKICLLLFFASYLARRQDAVRSSWTAFFVMVFIIGIIVVLLLLEPDFGSSVVITFTLGSMMFVAGVPILRFLLLASSGVAGFSAMAFLSPYRWERLVAFMDPWSRQFDSGYQLVQSLIAFGRGEWFGLGLGNSLQKLFFLPEAHTDFIFAIFAEEFGLIGALCLVALYVFFIFKILSLSREANSKEKLFSAYLCFGIGIMLAAQSFINMGVASGLLPTKGLTLPFISYGGSSLLITCALMALVFRVNWELRHEQ